MHVLITYDVATSTPEGERRLRRVCQVCKDFGQRVQKSVFECRIGSADWARLRHRLLAEADPLQDSLRFYFLDAAVQIEHHGANAPADLRGPLVV